MSTQALTPWEKFMVSVQQRQLAVTAMWKELDYKPSSGITPYARAAAFIHEDEAGLDEVIWTLARANRIKTERMAAIITFALSVTASTCELHRWLHQQCSCADAPALTDLMVEIIKRREPLFLQLIKLQA